MARKLTTQEVIERFKNIHGSTYDYSLVNYQGDSKKVKIICKHHGIFEQQPACHGRQKQGCPECGRKKANNIIKTRLIGNDKFIERIEKIFGNNKFDYSELNYIDAHTPLTLMCNKCNNKENKAPSVWYKGFGCLKCQGNTVGKKSFTTEKFIERAKKIHGDRYDYSQVMYINTWSKVKIICHKHGLFYQIPNVHINSKSGCPKCQTSKGEENIGIWLNNKEIKYQFQYNVKINNSNHYYDFYIPDYNIMIEFNGLQHYKPIKFFGGQEGFNYLQERDKIKEKYCLENQIKLLIIRYDNNIEEILNKTLNV
jgi:hypothetical protein